PRRATAPGYSRPAKSPSQADKSWPVPAKKATAQLLPLVRPHLSLTFGRPWFALSLLACPPSPKPRLPATHFPPYVKTARPRAPLLLRRQTAPLHSAYVRK